MAPPLQTALLAWYRANARDLPFRNTRDPYAVWVSEIMAQQTRMTALLPYYRAFMREFPDVATLAHAGEHDVLKAWEGLGYYSRARCLHRAAQIVADAHSGQVPDSRAALLALPGVGEYTAGAILSIAYGRREPAVDGNVLRVWARLTNDSADITRPGAKRTAQSWVFDLMPDDSPGEMTQTLMELGALVCVPKKPDCARCPAKELCASLAAGRERLLPMKTPKKPQRIEFRPVLLVFDTEGRVLMRRRHEALLHGLWEFPREAPDGLDILSETPCGKATHTFTHIKWEMEGVLCRTGAHTAPLPDGWLWADAACFRSLAIPSAFRVFSKLIIRNYLGGRFNGTD